MQDSVDSVGGPVVVVARTRCDLLPKTVLSELAVLCGGMPSYCNSFRGKGTGVEVPLRPWAVAVVWAGDVVGGKRTCVARHCEKNL